MAAVVVNGTGQLEQCVDQVSGIIDAEKARTRNRFDAAAAPTLPAC